MTPTTRRVLSDLRRQLAELAPSPGDQLPAERAIAQRLGCSRQTLRSCYDLLEQQGEIWRHVGQGTFRGARPRHLPMRDTLLVEGATPPDLMRARLVLEPQVAGEAARHATPADIHHLRAKVALGRAARDRSQAEQADDAFHQAVAMVSQNPVLIGLLTYLSGTRRRAAWQREWDQTYRRVGEQEFRAHHSDQHDQVVDAIAAKNPDAASDAMRHHLKTIEAAIAIK